MISLSTDMRIPNEAMKQSRCVQSPRVEDFTYACMSARPSQNWVWDKAITN